MMSVTNKLSGSASDKLRKKSLSAAFSIFRIVFLVIVGYIVLYPLLYMITNALKTESDFLDVSHMWLPLELTLDNFKMYFELSDIGLISGLKQTLILQMVSAFLEIAVCAFVAYGFARFNFPGKPVASFLLILSLLVPVQMYSMSLSVNYRFLHIFNTPFAYWLPALFGVGIRSGMLIYIYQQFFIGLPRELEDAAYVDGAGPLRTYFSIALPSSSVVIVTVSVLSIIWHWNESYLAELCFLDDSRPMAVVLSQLGTRLTMYASINTGEPLYPAAVSAGVLLYLVVPLVFYMVIQRRFVKSIDRVGITG